MNGSGDRSRDPAASEESPLVSVITVNHNGLHLLPEFLESLRSQTYRRHEVVVVDNASSDGSVGRLRRDFPEVRVLEQTRNLGFAAGNNAGIRASKGSFLALANNDTVAAPTWLEELVHTALEDRRIAAVGSKILFLRPFVPVRLHVEDAREAPRGWVQGAEAPGVLFDVESGFVGCDYDKVIFKEGFSGGTEVLQGRRVRRAATDASVYLPIRSADEGGRLRLVVAGAGLPAPERLQVHVGSSHVAEVTLGESLSEHPIDVPPEIVQSESFDVINNAGTALSPAGEAADRGIFEPDRGQYDREEDLEAVCGAAVLLRRSALEEIGLFDRDLFMYYEDTDLSWRLRRRGFRLRYQPRSVIRHRHAATSVEWSPLFTFFTARNRLLMIVKNGSLGAVVRAYWQEARLLAGFSIRWLRSPAGPRAGRTLRELATRVRVQASLLKQVPRAVLKRAGFLGDPLR